MEFFKTMISNLDQQTTIILIEAIVIIAVLDIFSPLFSYIIIKIFNWKKTGQEIKENAFYTPIKSFFRVLGVYMAIILLKPVFHIEQNTMDLINKIFKMIVIITTAVGLTNSITKKSMVINKIKEKSDRDIDDATTKMLIRIIKAVIYIIAGFMILADLGYDLSGLITGLGLGTVVITLAAQDTIKNLFAGIMIFTDKPFKIGDFVKFKEYQGTVEDITFRSTRLRTVQNTIAQIPNIEISNYTVINYSKMQKRRYDLNLGLVLNTDLEKMADLKFKILEFLKSQTEIIDGTEHVYFDSIGTNEYNVSIFFYTSIISYFDYLEFKEQINYGIMNIVNQNNIELAYDTKTIEIKS